MSGLIRWKNCTLTPYLHDNGWERTDPRSSRWSCHTICRVSGQKPPWTTSSTSSVVNDRVVVVEVLKNFRNTKKTDKDELTTYWWSDKRAKRTKKQLVANASLLSSIWSTAVTATRPYSLSCPPTPSSEAVVFLQLSAAFLDTCRLRRCQSPRNSSLKASPFHTEK